MTAILSHWKSAVLFCMIIFAIPVYAVEETKSGEISSQSWIKRGLIIAPGFAGPRSESRLSAPSVIRLKDGRLRMYFWAVGGEPQQHYIFAAESSAGNPFSWELVSSDPLLGPNSSGNIRDGGPSFPWVVPREDAPWLLYYCAWGSWAPEGELSNRTGLALSHDQGLTWRVEREAVLPLGQPGSHDAALTGSVDVLRTGENEYTMWYTAGERYRYVGNKKRKDLIAHVAMAHSSDGITWTKYPEAALSPRLDSVDPFENVVSKPSVLVVNGIYHMWFSVRGPDGKGYRLGYARSTDGKRWHREFEMQILSLTRGGFDSENQSYPNVVDMGNQLWMFYVGNRFGETGIGLATIDKDEIQ